jgi:hypothetical protein
MKHLLVVVFVVLPAVAHAQQIDARWRPWLGCWQLLDESVRQPLPFAAAALGAANARTSREAAGIRVCVAPAPEGNGVSGVTLTTTVEGQPALEQTIVADGNPHPLSEAECRGTQRAEWSRSGGRLFARAEVTCSDQTSRTVSGLAMISGGVWTDVQSVDVGGRENIRVRRYQRTASSAASIAPELGTSQFTIEDVKEAVTKISPRAVEAALVESEATFALNSRALLDLDKAGVPDSVIDLMVAVSYPKHFVVQRRENLFSTFATAYDPWSLSAAPYLPYFWPSYYPYDSLYSYYDRYGSYYYAPFGYSYWGSYGGSYYPGFVTVDPGQPDAPTGAGRAINGVGYTRITRPREVATRDSGNSNGSDGGVVSTGSSSGASSSSGGASPSGFSSGSSSSDSGRTAQPR